MGNYQNDRALESMLQEQLSELPPDDVVQAVTP